MYEYIGSIRHSSISDGDGDGDQQVVPDSFGFAVA